MNSSQDTVAEVPAAVTMVMSTVPVPAGATAVIEPSELTVKLVAATLPKYTAVAPVKWAPEMLTDVPPKCDPDDGLIPMIVGRGGAM